MAVDQTDACAEREHGQDRDRPRKSELRLQADGEDVPEHNAVADREVNLARDHRDHDAKRENRDDRLVGNDRANVKQSGKGLGQQEAEQERQRHRQDEEAVDRGEALEALDRAEGPACRGGSAPAPSI